MTFLKFTLITALFFVLFLLSTARADKLDWTNPTTRTGGQAFDPATEQGGVKIWKNGQVTATVNGAATTWNSGSTGCTPISWQVTVFDKTLPPVGPLESPLSTAVLGPVDLVGCAPKSPSGVRVSL